MKELNVPKNNDVIYKNSTIIETIFFHQFVAELISYCTKNNIQDIEVLNPLIDRNGYDIVLVINNEPFYIQFKTKEFGSSTRILTQNCELFKKENRFIILFEYDKTNFKLFKSVVYDLRNKHKEDYQLLENRKNVVKIPISSEKDAHYNDLNSVINYFKALTNRL